MWVPLLLLLSPLLRLLLCCVGREAGVRVVGLPLLLLLPLSSCVGREGSLSSSFPLCPAAQLVPLCVWPVSVCVASVCVACASVCVASVCVACASACVACASACVACASVCVAFPQPETAAHAVLLLPATMCVLSAGTPLTTGGPSLSPLTSTPTAESHSAVASTFALPDDGCGDSARRRATCWPVAATPSPPAAIAPLGCTVTVACAAVASPPSARLSAEHESVGCKASGSPEKHSAAAAAPAIPYDIFDREAPAAAAPASALPYDIFNRGAPAAADPASVLLPHTVFCALSLPCDIVGRGAPAAADPTSVLLPHTVFCALSITGCGNSAPARVLPADAAAASDSGSSVAPPAAVNVVAGAGGEEEVGGEGVRAASTSPFPVARVATLRTCSQSQEVVSKSHTTGIGRSGLGRSGSGQPWSQKNTSHRRRKPCPKFEIHISSAQCHHTEPCISRFCKQL